MWARKWDTYLAAERRRNNGRLRLRRNRKLKELVRHGIPNSARPEVRAPLLRPLLWVLRNPSLRRELVILQVWASILDLDRLAAAQKGEYARLLELRKGESTQAIQQIKLVRWIAPFSCDLVAERGGALLHAGSAEDVS
jgi:hypothetical protein